MTFCSLGNCLQWINWFKAQLEDMFEKSELGEGNVTLYLNAEFIQTPHGIFLTQRGYAPQTLETFNLQDTQSASTPMVERLKLKTDMNEEFVYLST